MSIQESEDRPRVDAIVIGAGLSGLTAARRCVDAGLSVVVLEARSRVGGRVWSRPLEEGGWLDLGGQWIGPRQTRVAALAGRLGLETFPTHTAGESRLDLAGHRARFTGDLPLAPADLAAIAETMAAFDAIAATIPPEAAHDAPRAHVWDGQTVETWLRRQTTGEAARAYLRVTIASMIGASTSELSLLHMLFYARAAGGLAALIDIDGGAQQTRIVGGTQQLAAALADGLGDRLRLDTPARAIEVRGPGDVTVHAADGSRRAAGVVVAVPPALAGRLAYDPPLPPARDLLTQRYPMGAVIKVQAVYPTPFWREAGLNGLSLSDRGPVVGTFDNSPPDESCGVLMGFVEGHEALRATAWPADRSRTAVLDAFAGVVGDGAARPLRYVEADWTRERWSGGGPVGYAPPGTWTGYGAAVRAPVGPIHWAGTETATVWNGYMEGALQAGERAADELLAGASGG